MSEGRAYSHPGVIIPLRPEGSRIPLFLIHGVDGDIMRFQPLANMLAADLPVYGIRSQALLGERALTRVEDMAAYYLSELRRFQERGPYYFLGFSFGAMVAFELASQLRAQGERVGMLAMLDSRPMTSFLTFGGRPDLQSRITRPTLRANSHFKNLFARRGLAYAREKLRDRSFRTIYTLLNTFRQPIPRSLQRAYDINWFAALRYAPVPYPGRIILFQTAETTGNIGSRPGRWEQLAGGGVEIREIAGGHGEVLNEPFLQPFARQLSDCLEAAAADVRRRDGRPKKLAQNRDVINPSRPGSPKKVI